MKIQVSAYQMFMDFTARARTKDPIGSKLAAAMMSENDNCKTQAMQVYWALQNHDGVSAKRLGILMAVRKTGLSYQTIEAVLDEARKPHSRLKQLVDSGMVRVEEDTEKKYFIKS